MKHKRRILIALNIILGFLVVNILATAIVYSCVFKRGHTLSMDSTPGVIDYEEYGTLHERHEVTYDSYGVGLTGYYYDENDTDKLVVVSSGIKDSADSLLMVDYFFLDNGYNVFSYDAAGCGKSDGNVKGFSEGLINLDSTLSYIKGEEEYEGYDIYLFGFSMGAYSSCAVTSLYDDIKCVAAVSGYNEAKNLVAKKGFDYVGPLSWLGAPIVNLMDRITFNTYLDYVASDSITSSNTPVFLARGSEDSLITEKYAISSSLDESDSIIKYEEEATHSSILYSTSAREYQKNIDEGLDGASDKAAYLSDVDDMKYSELNPVLFESILEFYARY